MKPETLHIKNPSPDLIEFAMKLRQKSEEKKTELLLKKGNYFPNSK